VKFGLKIPNRLGNIVRKPQGDFFTHTVYKAIQKVYSKATAFLDQ